MKIFSEYLKEEEEALKAPVIEEGVEDAPEIEEEEDYEVDFDFGMWVNMTECFGKSDLNDYAEALGALQNSFNELFGPDKFEDTFLLGQVEGLLRIISSVPDSKLKLIDVLRNLWEDEMDEKFSDRNENLTKNMVFEK